MIKTLYPCFQKWSEKGSVYIVSDTHFKDSDRKFMGYSISSLEQAYIIGDQCHKNDTLIHLGDVGDPTYMTMIKAHKVLIMGNHDQSIEKMEPYFDEVYSGPLWIAKKIVLSHEPINVEAESNREPIAINIHGHVHSGNIWNDYYHLNLAANVYGYIPFNLKSFIKNGLLKGVKDIHRVTIDKASEKSEKEENNKIDLSKMTKEEFIEFYCMPCGSQRCEGPDSDFGKGCKYLLND